MTGKEYAKKEYPNLEEGQKQMLAKAFDTGKDYAETDLALIAYMQGAEQREKRIAELEEIVQGYDRNRDRLIAMGFPTFQSCKEYADKIKDLEQQIEQMKRHCNCKHRDSEGYCEVKRTYLMDLSYDGCDKWELED